MKISLSLLLYVVWFFILFALEDEPLFNSRVNNGEVSYSEIDEASGIAASAVNPGVLWTHNDSGGESRIFAIGTDGSLKGIFYLEGIENRDWEDIAVGPGPAENVSYIYLADIGDNEAKHENKFIYRIEEPTVTSDPEEPVLIKNISAISFTYPDGERDAETIMIDPLTKDIFILGKRDTDSRLYKLPFPQSINENADCVLASLINFPFDPEDQTPNNYLTGGDISADGSEIIVKSYSNVFYWKRNDGETVEETMSATPENIYYVKEPQGEAICWENEGVNGYYTLSEELTIGEFTFSAYLYYYPRNITASVENRNLDHSLFLRQNYPNPFNAGTNIEYDVTRNGSNVKLIVYDNLGRKIKILVDEIHSAGKYNLKFYPADLQSGIYFYKIQIGDKTDVKKLIYLK